MTLDCPKCRKINPPRAQRCDCGYDFASGQLKRPHVPAGEPKGFGGWLILPAIGLVMTPFRLGSSLLTEYGPLFSEGVWDVLTTPGTEAYHPLWAPLLMLEIAGNVFLAVFAIVLLLSLYDNSHRFPRLIIAFLVLNPLFLIVDAALTNSIPVMAEQDDARSRAALVSTLVAAAIWIPYFCVSRRVKNTFVRPPTARTATAA